MNKMKGWQKIGMLLCVLSLLTGCWDYSPLERAFLVEGIAIDQSKKKPNQLEVTIIDVDFKRKKRALSAEGRTISEAINRIQDQLSKIVVLSHVKIILLSDEVSKKNVLPYFDLFLRNMQVSNEASFVVAQGRAKDFFNPKNLTYNISGRTYSQMIQSSETKYNNRLYKIHNIIVEMMARDDSITLPLIKLDKKKKVASFSGLALIHSGKLVGKLSTNESKAYFILRRVMNRMAYTMKVNKNQMMTVRLYEKGSSVKCIYRNGKWNIDFRVAFNQEIVESGRWNNKRMSKAQSIKLERTLERKLKKDSLKLLHKLQKKYEYDPFWLAETARLNQPHTFDASEWDDQFARAKVNVHVNVHLERFGQLF
jgi:spore germination protein KC